MAERSHKTRVGRAGQRAPWHLDSPSSSDEHGGIRRHVVCVVNREVEIKGRSRCEMERAREEGSVNGKLHTKDSVMAQTSAQDYVIHLHTKDCAG